MMILSTNWANVAVVTLFGVGMVFFILCVLVLILQLFGLKVKVTFVKNPKKTVVKENTTSKVSTVHTASEAEKAAIAMALHLYFAEVHDTESYRLTIRQNSNTAWNSKIFGMNNLNK